MSFPPSEISPSTFPPVSQTLNPSELIYLDDVYAAVFPEQLQGTAHFPPESCDPQPEQFSDYFSPIQDDADFLFHPPIQACETGGSAAREEESDSFLLEHLWGIPPGEAGGGLFQDFLETPDRSESSNLKHRQSSASIIGEAGNPELREEEQEGKEEEEYEDEEEEEDAVEEEEPKPICSSKNLLSEKNRRRRLSRQILSLRALVPNITKMDKMSVLVDALSYLKNIHEQTAMIQAELKQRPLASSPLSKHDGEPVSSSALVAPPPRNHSNGRTQILEIDAEKIEDRRFIVKTICKGSAGASAKVLQIIESLGYEITFIALEKIDSKKILSTTFLRIRRAEKMTEEKLRDNIKSKALRLGLKLLNP